MRACVLEADVTDAVCGWQSGRRSSSRRARSEDGGEASSDAAPAATPDAAAPAATPDEPSSAAPTPGSAGRRRPARGQQRVVENSDDEGEDINDEDAMRRDYQAVPELDTYDAGDLDGDDYSPMSPSARLAAEESLQKRDRDDVQRGARVPRALRGFDDDDEFNRPSRRRFPSHSSYPLSLVPAARRGAGEPPGMCYR